jgi:SNF2 family DNA or RNA helicase/uncharacterized Zn finger protein
MAIEYGKTWWGKQWLLALNNIDYSNRLDRGRTYANKGSVTELEFVKNKIKAKVKGSAPRPYKIEIEMQLFEADSLQRFLENVALQPLLLSKLLNRSLDPLLLELANKQGLVIFPKEWSDIKMKCSCPDYAVPCKHLAAVVYKVCNEIDNNPFLAFDLHGIVLADELKKNGYSIPIESMQVPTLLDFLIEKKATQKLDFDVQKAFQKFDFTSLVPITLPLISLLKDDPAFYPNKKNFKEIYKNTLLKIIRTAEKLLLGNDISTVFKSVKKDEFEITKFNKQEIIIDKTGGLRVIVDEQEINFTVFAIELHALESNRTQHYQASTAFLYSVLQSCIHLIAAGAVVPAIMLLPNQDYKICWMPSLLSQPVKQLVEFIENRSEAVPFYIDQNNTNTPISSHKGQAILSVFLNEVIAKLNPEKDDDLYVNMFFKGMNYSFSKPGEDALSGGIMAWLQKYSMLQNNFVLQIKVQERDNDKFLIEPSLALHNQKLNINESIDLKQIITLKKHENIKYEVLRSFAQLSGYVPGLDEYINSQCNDLIIMDFNSFTPFLLEIVPAMQLLNVEMLLPKSLKNILHPKPTIKLSSKSKNKSVLNINSLFEFDWQVAIGDEMVSVQELKKLLSTSYKLLKYKSQYIHVNPSDLEKLNNFFTKTNTITQFELLSTALSGEYLGTPISMTSDVKQRIKEMTEIDIIPLPIDIKAKLRPYQLRGYSWMYRNAKVGFGSLLADDMGLGKTIQVITSILKFKEENQLTSHKALIITPTGLLNNWLIEFEKFAPSVVVQLYHGSNRSLPNDTNYDVLLTSYGTARSDSAALKKLKWHVLIIDEAQNIKNAVTGQSKAIKSIPANNFIAMSGTPVENRLSELWSIMDFCNRGILGTAKEFSKAFANPIEQYNNAEKAALLRKITAPFLMRRLKTDKTIISDLPDKVEINCYATLNKIQAGLYTKTLESAMSVINEKGDDSKALFERQGLILQMILALKQICNHPTNFLKNNNLAADLSGKTELLFSILDSIIDNGEKVLIFTQFTEMGKLLEVFIKERYKIVPMYYHGACTLKQRNSMVEEFQTNHAQQIFILSLKAAGTGLNLTAAQHVIHYDLWWNPAVEAQATDRAYRIGQKNNVFVHRLITKNTFEEKINNLIINKKALADLTIQTGESWIGNLNNKDLKELFTLTNT